MSNWIPDSLWNWTYKWLARPFLFSMTPEEAHHAAMSGLKLLSSSPFLLEILSKKPDPKLERTVFGLKFPNPVGLAAGFDKNAEVLPAWGSLGFGFVEAGTVTALAQPGNPKPRIFRYPEKQALINRMGFNNDGCHVIAQRLQDLSESGLWPKVPVGLNLGKSKATTLENAANDYLDSFLCLNRYSDYLVINVSSPNTPGLRVLQDKNELKTILRVINKANADLPVLKPILVKIAPDLSLHQVDDVLSIALECELAGLVVSNTTLDHTSIRSEADQIGGLSGAPLFEKSNEILRHVTKSTKLPVIASGGVMSSDAAMAKFDAGASLVQVYTGYVYRGPALIGEICARLKAI